MSPFVVPTVYVDFAPTAEETQLVTSWASERGLRLRAATPWSPAPVLVDPAVANAIEDDIAHARDAILGLDFGTAKASQAHASALLLAHPELPQAAFLLAEWYRVEAERLRRLEPSDEAAPRVAATAAMALDGGHALAMGETAPAPSPPVLQSLQTDVPVPEDAQFWLDGTPIGTAAAATRGTLVTALVPGPHHARVTVAGHTIAATWIQADVTPQARPYVIAWPKPPACSEPVLRAAMQSRKGSEAGAPTLCDDFFSVQRETQSAAAAKGPSLLIARCNAFGCGAAQPIRRRPEQRPRSGAWIPWFFVGATTTAASLFALAAAGVFTQGKAPAPLFRNGGIRVENAN